MSNSFVRSQIYKDAQGYIHIDIEAEIYFEDKEMYFLTHQMGPRWRHEAGSFINGDETESRWRRRINSYIDRQLNKIGLTSHNVTDQTFTTQFVAQWGLQPQGPAYQWQNAVGGRREFTIEITTDKTGNLPRNRLLF